MAAQRRVAELVEVVEPGVVLARAACVSGFYGVAPPGMKYARRHRELNDEMTRLCERWAYLHVVDLSLGAKVSLAGDVRDAMVDNMRKSDPVVPAAAVVFLGGGFTAAAVRALGTSLLLVARLKGEYKFVSSVEAGINHVRAHAARIGPAFPDAGRLAAFVDEMRSAAHASR
jgi:hypothetical protein